MTKTALRGKYPAGRLLLKEPRIVAQYPRTWMNLTAKGVRIAALGSALAATLYFIIVYKTYMLPPGADGMLPLFSGGQRILVNTRPGLSLIHI